MADFITEAAKCTGCGACVNICKKNAVQMISKNNGFQYAVTDSEKCIKCGQCFAVCERRKQTPEDLSDSPLVYAMRSDNTQTRIHSTSGGIFSELAECILKRKGRVAGAVYMPDWSAEHRLIRDSESLELLRRSKYQQSRTGLIYREVKEVLDKCEEVLFCGTPCQVGGLKAFLGKEYKNLFTCDFICRGVSSPKIFAKYIEDLRNTYGSDITYVWMKNKCRGWHSLTTVIGFSNGEEYIEEGAKDSYVQLYLKHNAGVRESCYHCEFKGENHGADVTLGDFWGLTGTELDDNLGTSIVICRTRKGRRLVDEIKGHVLYQEKRLEDVKRGNPCLYNPIGESMADQEEFYNILEREGYQQAVRWIAEADRWTEK